MILGDEPLLSQGCSIIHSNTRKEIIQSKSTSILMRIKSLQGVEITQTSSHSSKVWRDLSLLSSLLYDMNHTHTWQKWKPKVKGVEEGSRLAPSHNTPMVLFICDKKRLDCAYGLKWKLLLLKGSLVWLQLCRTWYHWTDHLLLLFHVTSTMMPCHTPVPRNETEASVCVPRMFKSHIHRTIWYSDKMF
jgi:hypothetical protein